MVIANAAASAVSPTERINGTSWLIIIWPAVVPRQYATHRAAKVGVLIMSRVRMSTEARARAATAGAAAGALYPAGGFLSSAVPISPMTKNVAPSIWKVVRQPYDAISCVANGPMMAEPAPYPPTINPTARPRLSGNHFEATGVGAE